MSQTSETPKKKRGRPKKQVVPTAIAKPTTPNPIDLGTLDFSWSPGPKAKYLGEVFTKLPTFATDEQRVIWLRHNNSVSLRYVLQLAFAPVRWIVEGVAYKPFTGRQHGAPCELIGELRRLYLYLDGSGSLISAEKAQLMYTDLLESLAQDEAELVESIRTHDYEKYKLTYHLVDAAFPGLLGNPFKMRFIR